MPSSRRKLILFPLTLALVLSGWAEKPLQPPGLRNLPRHSAMLRAGYIFSGTVKTIERLEPRPNSGVAVMQVTFHVDQGFRGAASGQTLVIREWAGLWQASDHYRVGERVMLFLYPPSKLGLTSPIGGTSGRYSVDSGGQVVLTPYKVNVPAEFQLPANGRIEPGNLLRLLRHNEEWR